MTQSTTSSPRGSEVPLESRGVMVIEISQNEEISGGGRTDEEKKSVVPSIREERIGGAYTLGNDSEEELLRKMLTLHNQSRD